jgi:peptidyl-prolyl cis-trans isomerase SurA
VLLCSAMVTLGVAQSKRSKQKEGSKPADLFTVNGSAVSNDEFIYLYKKNHQNKAEDYTKEKIDEYLNLFINFKLKVEEAKKRGMDTTAVFLKEFNQYKEELRRPYLPDSRLTDSLVRLTYDRMKEEINASHILISAPPEATPADTLKAYQKIIALRNRILAGEDFARVAAENSEDPSGKMNGGNLGYFSALQMVYPFETAAYNTRIGEVSNPVRSRFGYHIIKVNDRRPASGEVEVSHIMVRTGNGQDDEKAKNTIFDVFDQLRAGVKWEDLCKQYSEDPGSKDNGGRLRPFGVGGMGNVPQFEEAAFGLKQPGEISDPFQTQYGWHIVRLERKIPLQSFEELAPGLKNKISRDERTQVSKRSFQQKLRKEYQFTENSAVKEKVLASGDTSLQQRRWKAPAFPNAEKETLFSLAGRKFTVKVFLVYAQKNQRRNDLSPEKYLDQLYNNFVDQNILQLLEAKIIRQNPEYAFLLKEYYEGILLFEIMEKEVWSKASEDSTGQRRYFNEHASDYKAGERVKAVFYSSQTKDFVEPLSELITRGDEAAAQEYAATHKVKSESGFYKKDDKPVLKKVQWAKGVYSAENNGIYYLAWLKDILPPGPMSFEEARPAVISDYQTFLEKNWIEQLRKKYRVKVNERSKQHILDQLQKQ